MDEVTAKLRLTEIVEMLELDDILNRRALGLSPDNKQKIPMGAGRVAKM